MTSFKGVKRITSQTDFRRCDIAYKMNMLRQRQRMGRRGEIQFVDDYLIPKLKEKQLQEKNADKYLNSYLDLPPEEQAMFANFEDYKNERIKKEIKEQYEADLQAYQNSQNQENNGNQNLE